MKRLALILVLDMRTAAEMLARVRPFSEDVRHLMAFALYCKR